MTLVSWLQLAVAIATPLVILIVAVVNHRATGRRMTGLENRIDGVGRNVEEIRRELRVLGTAMAFAAGRQAEADARVSGSQQPGRGTGSGAADVHH